MKRLGAADSTASISSRSRPRRICRTTSRTSGSSTPSDPGIPFGFWRSVGASFKGYVIEAFIDEMATTAGKDPYEFRRDLLSKAPRHLAVLDLVAEKSGWDKPLPQGRARGIIVIKWFGSIVSRSPRCRWTKGQVRVHRDAARWTPAGSSAPTRSNSRWRAAPLRPDRRAQGRHHHPERSRDAAPLQRLPDDPPPRDAADRGLHRAEHGEPRRHRRTEHRARRRLAVNAVYAATGKRVYSLPIKPETLRRRRRHRNRVQEVTEVQGFRVLRWVFFF